MAIAGSRPLVADLTGRVAIVTGAGGRIGRATAIALAESGARVVVNDVRGDQVEATVGAIRSAGGQAHGVVADMGKSAEIDRLFEETTRVFGPVSIQVNCAAIMNTRGNPLDFDDDRIDQILAVNLRGVLLCSLRAARIMAVNGGGAIVNLSSVGGSQRSHHRNLIYDTAKGGIDAITRSLTTDIGHLGIRVNAVGPAATATEPPEGRGQDLPLRRGGTPEDVAYAILYLVSDAARFVSGQVLYVDGGLMAQLRSPEAGESVARGRT